MELKQLEYFLRLCEDKTFSRAAQNLYLTHQGLNKAIRSLEEELGVSLYWKDKRNIVLTDAGEEFSRQARVVLEDAAALKRKMAAFAEKGNLRVVQVACAYAVYGELYPLFFSGLKEEYPQLRFEFSEYPDLLCEQAVLGGEADVGFTIGPVRNEQLTEEPLVKHGLCALVNKKNPLARRKKLCCEDLKNEKIMIANKDFKIYHIFMERCRLTGIDPDIVFLGSEISSIHSLCGAGKGIAVTVDFVGRYPGCQTIPLEPGVLDWTICMVSPRQRACAGPVRDAVSFVRKVARERAANTL